MASQPPLANIITLGGTTWLGNAVSCEQAAAGPEE
jgi:hypothetical protein